MRALVSEVPRMLGIVAVVVYELLEQGVLPIVFSSTPLWSFKASFAAYNKSEMKS
mgnify:CR=1 FL=1